jgi:hypothetical protein
LRGSSRSHYITPLFISDYSAASELTLLRSPPMKRACSKRSGRLSPNPTASGDLEDRKLEQAAVVRNLRITTTGEI